MKQKFSNMKKHIFNHKYKYLSLAVFLKCLIICFFASIVINIVHNNNTHAQTILPLSTNVCNIYNEFIQFNWMNVENEIHRLIDNETYYSIENFPYLRYFSAVANYNM